MIVVNERNRAVLHASFYNLAGVLTAPFTLEYRIDDKDSGQQIREWTPIGGTLTAEMDIPLTSLDNAMVDPQRPFERRIVTLRADYDGDTSDETLATADYEYQVRNLRFLE